MSIFGTTNSIQLDGNGNITVQNSSGVTIHSLNLNDNQSVEKFFAKFEDNIQQLSELITKLKHEKQHQSDFQKFSEIVKEKITIKKHFTVVKTASELTVRDVLDLRANSYQKLYFKREIDDAIFDALTNEQSVLIIGNSLSGKTRAVYEVLKNPIFSDDWVIIPEMVSDFMDFPKLENITLFQNPDKKKIVFIDDIDKYFQKENANTFIRNILRNGMTIIATCMTGPEYDTFLKSVDNKIEEQFELIEIPKIEENIVAYFKQANMRIEKENFDGNIGSLFLNLTVMKKRYQKLLNQKQDKTVKIALLILDILKALYFSANFEQKSSYSIEKIKDFYFRKIEKKNITTFNNQLQQQLNEKILKEEYENIARHWDDAIELLSNNDTGLNFINKQNDWIRIEETYFDKQILSTNYSSQDISTDIFKLYADAEERKQFGFYVKIKQFNILISKATTYQQAFAVYTKMLHEKIKPDQVTFNSLINKAPDFETGKAFLAEMEEKGIKPDQFTFTSLINKAPDFETGKAFLAEMATKGIKPDQFTFNILINKAPDFETSKAFLDKMEGKGIKPDQVTFGSLIKLVQLDPQQAKEAFFKTYKYDFFNHYDNKFIAYFFDYFDYGAFINEYFEAIIDTNDRVILHYANTLERRHNETDAALAINLLGHIKDKNAAEYCNLLANLYRYSSPPQSVELYKKALKSEKNTKNKAKYHHNIASLIYENKWTEQFAVAIHHCEQALNCNKNFEHSKKLLLFLTAISKTADNFMAAINQLIKKFGFQKEKIYRSIITELKKYLYSEEKIEQLRCELQNAL